MSVEDLTRLSELDATRTNLGVKLLSLELEKIHLLAAGRRVAEEQDALFRRIAADRGIPDNKAIDINPRTGEVAVDVDEPGPSSPGGTPEG